MSGEQFLLDTNIVVPFLNGDKTIIKKIKSLTVVQLPFIVPGELYYGAHKSSKITQNLNNIEEFIKGYCTIYYPSEQTLGVYGKLKQSLSKQGTPIPENDIWIAAIAQEYDLKLVTRDNHFSHIDKLNTVVW